MTFYSTNTNDQDRAFSTKGENKIIESASDECSTNSSTQLNNGTTTNNEEPERPNGNHDKNVEICYNQILDDEIRSRLDKLNALSDLINSLERQFDEANIVFRDTLKCSTDRLSSIAKTLGTKSIRHGRIYHAAKLSVEQSQSDCQKACVQFEQANKDHQFAKKAIKDAELKLTEIAGDRENVAGPTSDISDSIDMEQLNLDDPETKSNYCNLKACDNNGEKLDSETNENETNTSGHEVSSSTLEANKQTSAGHEIENSNFAFNTNVSPTTTLIKNSAKLSEELNQAIMKLIEAERQRGLSERLHSDRANKLMIAQENLIKLQREHGPSIRRSQLYFDEAKRFNAKLSSVKGGICKISEDILAAKQAYAQTLSELEQFSDNLHDNSKTIASLV